MLSIALARPPVLYQKRACRNLQSAVAARVVALDCIRKEPAAIYNTTKQSTASCAIVSEKSLPQSTIGIKGGYGFGGLYQKRACRNLQFMRVGVAWGLNCIRKEPAAIYNCHGIPSNHCQIVSEKSLPQSTIGMALSGVSLILYQKRACRNLQF